MAHYLGASHYLNHVVIETDLGTPPFSAIPCHQPLSHPDLSVANFALLVIDWITAKRL